MPRFSIIIGHYQQWDKLPILLDSLKRQTFQDFEVHLCDDGSANETEVRERIGKIVNEVDAGELLAKMRVHVQPHKNMRLARNINQGVEAARGQYCLFIMGDSFLELDYLDTLDKYVASDRIVCGIRVQVDMVDGKMQGVDIDWRIKKNAIPEVPSVVINSPWMCLTGNGLCIPTEALIEHGGWPEELEGYGGDDNELVARLYYKGYLCWSVPDLRLYHHWHKSQDTAPGNAEKAFAMIKNYAR